MSDPNEWGTGPEYDEAYENFDSFEMSSEGVDASKVGSGHRNVDKPGKYHFAETIATAKPSPYGETKGVIDMSKSRKPSILLACKVVATLPDQSPVGSIHYHELVVSGSGKGVEISASDKEQTLSFLVGVGVLKKRGDVVIDPETGTQRINVGTLVKRLQGLQFIGIVKLRKGELKKDRETGEQLYNSDGTESYWEDKIGFSWGRGCYQVDADEVADVPKSLEHLRQIGMEHCMPALKAADPKSHKPAAATPSKSGQAAKNGQAPKNSLDDLDID